MPTILSPRKSRLARMMLAAHRVEIEIGRLYRKQTLHSAPFRLPRCSLSKRLIRSVLRRRMRYRLHRASSKPLSLMRSQQKQSHQRDGSCTSLLDDYVGGLVAQSIVGFSRVLVTHIGPLSFDVTDRRSNGFGLPRYRGPIIPAKRSTCSRRFASIC